MASNGASKQSTINGQPEHEPRSPNETLQMGRAVRSKAASLKEMSRRDVERRRRNDMGILLATLRALLPTALKSKRRRHSHCAILTETLNYIAALNEQRKELAREKADLIASKGASVTCAHNKLTDDGNALTGKKDPNSLLLGGKKNSPIKTDGWPKVEVSRAKRDIFITISASGCAALLSGALLCMENFDLNVLNACLSTNAQLGFLSIHSQLLPCADRLDIGKLRDELHQLVTGEVMVADRNENHVEEYSKVSNSDVHENYPLEQSSAAAIEPIPNVFMQQACDPYPQAWAVDSPDCSEFEAIFDYKY